MRKRWRVRLVILGALALVVIPVVGVAATVISTTRYILTADAVEREDVYVASSSAVVEGTIEGDLVIATGDLDISGTVEGDVLVASRARVTVTGTIEGSLRGIARSVVVSGEVGHEVAVATLSLSVSGRVGRDVLTWAGTADVDGEVGRDVLGRAFDVTVSGDIDRDIDMSVRGLTLSSGAVVGGDVVYKSNREATVADDVVIGDQLIRLSARPSFFVGIVLRIAFLLGFFGYLVAGIVLIWLFNRTAGNAIRLATAEPLRALGAGAVTLVAVPLLVGVLAFTLVGIPLAVVALVALVAVLLVGTVPFVAAVGSWTLRDRGGPYAGFLLGSAVWWFTMFLVPALGALVFLVALTWGVGSWLLAGWRLRRESMAAG